MRALPLLLFASVAFGFSPIEAQERSSKGKGSPMSFEGEKLPDVSGFDEEGNPFPLQQKLKGRHGVIIFGCLT